MTSKLAGINRKGVGDAKDVREFPPPFIPALLPPLLSNTCYAYAG